ETDPSRDEAPRRRRTGHRPYQGRAPHGAQLSQGARRRPHQCCARRRRLQLWPPPALARRAFARPVAGALHSALGSTTGLKPAAPSYFTSDVKKRGRPETASPISQMIGRAYSPSLVARARSRPITPRQGGGAYHRLILVEARQTIGTQLAIAVRAALPAHGLLAEAGANLQQPVIVAALDNVPARIPVAEIA